MEATLTATPRASRGKNEARRLRVSGRIPAVVYGAGSTEAISVDPKVLSRILHSESGANTLIALDLEGQGTSRVLVKEFLINPITHALLHCDFYRVAMDKPIQVSVHVEVVGEPRGVKVQGGVLDFVQRQIEVECLPADIPEKIEIDVTDLVIGQAVRVRDIAGAKWTAITDADVMLVHVVPARTTAEPTADAAATPSAPAEPEVIKKGKTEKGEE